MTVLPASAVFAQTQTNALTFELGSTSVAAGSTGNTITLCAVNEANGPGYFQTVAPGTVLVFRFGVGFGTLQGISGARLTHWFGSALSGTPVALGDFTSTMNAANGKIVFTYTPLVAHDLAFRDQICVDASWDAPVAGPGNIIDFNNNVGHINTSLTTGKMLWVQ